VQHQASVQLQWSIPEPQAAALVARINDGGQGRIDWLKFWPS